MVWSMADTYTITTKRWAIHIIQIYKNILVGTMFPYLI